ncbi:MULTISPECIES: Gfo/Idh/MocA family protein [Paenibacillus]|uniref:Gfo/Idh/MocA family protein n=1 Tax=Paenibacillus TaxID=44249 RepID=UPI0005CE33CD|nr:MULTISPECIES: Gfo/Idh/MocA family oxidoreductase [Paenibacillus]KAF6587338.1 Gfo/Idh/MocA family oxidoreductase [Paenibacillus sp. EKM211P]KJD40284.1 oxidoreductase [Paenibacillus polymyxa]
MGLKYALIGCGRISSNHIAAATSNELDIVALCDVIPQYMDAKISEFNLQDTVHLYTDYHLMLQNEDIDLIAICTESGSHGAIALDCLHAGVNLIIEKPIALSLEEADAIIELAVEKKLKVSACHQNRFNKSIQKIKEAIDHERFGRLLHGTAHVRWNREEGYYSQSGWRGTWEHDGGTLMNQCIHNIDLLRWLMGNDITEVIGMTDNLKHDYIQAEDMGLAIVKFANGSYGLIEGTVNIFEKNLEETLYIFGEKGTAKAGGKSVNLLEEWHFADQKDNLDEIIKSSSEYPSDVYGFGHTALYADVIKAIVTDVQPYVTAEDGRRALELVLAIYKSAAEGRSIRLPLYKSKTTDFARLF